MIPTSSSNISMTKVATLPLIPMKRLMHVSTTYAVLGTLNRKDAGYIIGVMDHLGKEGRRNRGVETSLCYCCSMKEYTVWSDLN